MHPIRTLQNSSNQAHQWLIKPLHTLNPWICPPLSLTLIMPLTISILHLDKNYTFKGLNFEALKYSISIIWLEWLFAKSKFKPRLSYLPCPHNSQTSRWTKPGKVPRLKKSHIPLHEMVKSFLLQIFWDILQQLNLLKTSGLLSHKIPYHHSTKGCRWCYHGIFKSKD